MKAPYPSDSVENTEVSIDDFDNVIIVNVAGEFRLNTLEGILEIMENRLAKGLTVFAINFSHVSNIDSAGLGVLVQYQKRLRKKGIPLVITDMSSEIQKVIEVAKLDYLIDTMSRDEFCRIYPCAKDPRPDVIDPSEAEGTAP